MTPAELQRTASDHLSRVRRGEYVDGTDFFDALLAVVSPHEPAAGVRLAAMVDRCRNSLGRVVTPLDQASASGGLSLSHPPEADDPINRARRTR